jgi:hypothetical protein
VLRCSPAARCGDWFSYPSACSEVAGSRPRSSLRVRPATAGQHSAGADKLTIEVR